MKAENLVTKKDRTDPESYARGGKQMERQSQVRRKSLGAVRNRGGRRGSAVEPAATGGPLGAAHRDAGPEVLGLVDREEPQAGRWGCFSVRVVWG